MSTNGGIDQELKERVRSVVATVTGLPADFSAEADLYLQLAVPSVKAIQLLLQLEESFAITIPDDSFVQATTLDALTAMVHQLVTPDLKS